jgi:uncharacterized membrane protein YraQ (UPF0718 family)
MIELAGTIGALLLVWCGVPLLIATVRAGHARGVSGAFLAAWLAGELLVGAYVLAAPRVDWLLGANYACNALIVAIVLGIKVRGDRA